MDQLIRLFSQPAFIIPFTLWVLIWKGLSLWKAASRRQVIWFILLLIFNSVGILEILYFFWLSRFEMKENEKVLSFLKGVGKKIEDSFRKLKKS